MKFKQVAATMFHHTKNKRIHKEIQRNKEIKKNI